ncbi:MAG: tannase/feruloyl esterase family alpha/beta hydrolase, partial [Clostridia bacterium]|nr:tannase/feruloyl esterase family alpha/beta hydrolase [Clostridia bacterium]
CSAGGLQSYSEVQRYPKDYDGVIAGVPSNNASNLVVYFLWLFNKLHDENGKSKIEYSLAKEISLKSAKFFQLHGDGEKGDDFITFGYIDENTITNFIEFLSKEMPNLTKEQLDLLQQLYLGVKNPERGQQIFCGLPIGSERNCNEFLDSKTNKFGYFWFRLLFGEDFDERNFDFDKDYQKFIELVGEHFSATDTNIQAFFDNDGKFLSFSGLADPSGPWADNLKYYNSVCENLGGYDIVSKSFKLFLLPGKSHGNAGLGVNKIGYHQGNYLIDVVRDWREKGIEPMSLSCSHVDVIDGREVVKFTREIPPYKNDKKVEGKDFPPST